MSFLIAQPELVAAAATSLARIESALGGVGGGGGVLLGIPGPDGHAGP
jgi:hypothetical protein